MFQPRLHTELHPAETAGFRRKTTLARCIARSRIPIAASLLCSSVMSQAAFLEIVNDDSSLKEGSSLDIQLKVTAEVSDNIGRNEQCTVNGRLLARNIAENPNLLPSDYSWSQAFSITFNGVTPNESVTAVAPAVLPSDIVQLLAVSDQLVEQDEVLQIFIDSDSVSVTCSDGVYGGPIVNIMGETYGPLVTLQDKSFDTVAQSKIMMPQVESIAVLTVSGAQARNKTLARQMGQARDDNAPRNRASVKLDGTDLPQIGGAAGEDAFSPWGIFVSGDFERGDRTLDQQNAFDFTTNTVVAGVDYKLGEHWVLGGSLSRSSANAEIKNKVDETQLDQNAISLFSSFYSQQCYIDIVASQGINDYDLLRSIGSDKARATTDGKETSLGLGAGYNYDLVTSTLKFFSRLDYMRADVDGYTETAEGTLLPVIINDFELKSFTANVGAGWTWVVNTSFGVLTPEIGVDFEHQFEGDGFNVDGQFVGGGEPGKFEISTLQKDANYINGNLALNAVFANGFSSFVGYTGQWGRDDWSSDHYSLGARLEF